MFASDPKQGVTTCSFPRNALRDRQQLTEDRKSLCHSGGVALPNWTTDVSQEC